jgi:hypothetical protein
LNPAVFLLLLSVIGVYRFFKKEFSQPENFNVKKRGVPKKESVSSMNQILSFITHFYLP